MSDPPRSDPALDQTLSNAPAQDEARVRELPVVESGHYALEGEEGRGGLGKVVRAVDRRLGRTVAIKELLHPTPRTTARFVREAAVTARLQHPGVVPIYEAGRWPSGEPFYAMKLVSGRSLSELTAEAASLDARLALLPNLLTVAETIAYAHNRGVVHRDLKPSNVMVGEFGEVLVIDWGLAKTVAPEEDPGEAAIAVESELTSDGQVLGTPQYMAPEQARGEAVDERADVYALGAILYQILAGRAPYSGDAASVLAAVVAGPPEPLASRQAGVPPELSAIVGKAMARPPRERYPSARELAEELRRFQTGQLVASHRYTPGALLLRFARRHRSSLAIASLFLVLLAVGGVVAIRRIVDERTAAERRRNELILVQARNATATDPTASLAWIATYPVEGERWNEARDIAVEAGSRGVARQVLRHPGGVDAVTLSPDGERLATVERRTVRLWRLADGALLGRLEMAGQVAPVAFSPDGKTLVAGDWTGLVKSWDGSSSGARELAGHHGPINAIAFAPDGSSVVTACDDRTLRRWNLATGEGAVIAGHSGEVTSVVFSADGARLVSASADGTVRSWSARGEPERVLQAGKLVFSALLSPDGTTVAAQLANEPVVLAWRLSDGERRRLEGHRAAVTRLAFAGDGRLASADAEGDVWLWSPQLGRERLLRLGSAARDLAFSADGRRLAAASVDGLVRIWDLNGGGRVLRGHRAAVNWLAFAPNAIVSGSDDRTARVWPLEELGRELRGHAGVVSAVAFVDGDQLVSAGHDRTLRLWDLRAGAERIVFEHQGAAIDVVPLSDGSRVISTANDGSVRLWDPASHSMRTLGESLPLPQLPAVSHDDAWVAVPFHDGSVRLWRLDGGGEPQILRGHSGPVRSVAFSRDDRTLASAGDDRAVLLWDRASGRSRRLGEHDAEAGKVLFLDDGSLVSAGTDGTVRAWNPGGGERARLSLGGTVRIAAHQDLVAATAADDVVRLWRPSSGVVRTLSGATSELWIVRFSPDGRWLAAGGLDRAVHVWNVESGASGVAHRHGEYVYYLAFSRDGGWLASSSLDGTAWVGPVRLPTVAAEPRAVMDWLRDQTAVSLGALGEERAR